MKVPEWLKKDRLVSVLWEDITEQCNIEKDKKLTPVVCLSVGWVDSIDNEYLVIITEERESVVDKQIFPWGVIKGIYSFVADNVEEFK